MIPRSSGTLQDYHSLPGTHLQRRLRPQLKSSGLSTCRACHHTLNREHLIKMNHPWMLLFFAVCALWSFAETVPCDQCGRECADICGTRQFRACCFNNMRKRHSDFFGLKFWMRPRRYAIHLYPAYDA